MQIMDQFGAAPGAESVRMPDGTERTLAAEHAAAILVNEQPAFRVVCTPELLPQLALGRLLTEGWITSADEVERVAVCAQGLKISVQLRHPLAAAEQAGQEVPSCCTDNLTLASPVQLPPLAPVPQREIPAVQHRGQRASGCPMAPSGHWRQSTPRPFWSTNSQPSGWSARRSCCRSWRWAAC